MQQLMIAGAVLAGLGGSMWLLHRNGYARFAVSGTRRSGRKLEMIERLQLSPQHAICLVRIEDRTLLIATAPANCSVLTLKDLA